jgi:hypothetical protein
MWLTTPKIGHPVAVPMSYGDVMFPGNHTIAQGCFWCCTPVAPHQGSTIYLSLQENKSMSVILRSSLTGLNPQPLAKSLATA